MPRLQFLIIFPVLIRSSSAPRPNDKAADLGDPESYFYLSLLLSAGLDGGEPGSSSRKDQARIWGLCGTHADNTNAHLLLA